MLKKYRKLWVFGDSYSTPNYFVEPGDSYWGLAATHLKIPKIANLSASGNSFDSIEQLLVSTQEDIDWTNDFIFIGIPPLERITLFDDFKDTEYIGRNIDTNSWEIEEFDVPGHRGLVSRQFFNKDQYLVIHSDRAWLETQALRKVFLLTQWLDSNKANYLIQNFSKPLDLDNQWGPAEFVSNYVKNHSRCIILDNTYYSVNVNINRPADFDQYGWFGHHGAIGNLRYFEKGIIPRLETI